MLNSKLPNNLTRHFITLCADLRGSRKTEKYAGDKYDTGVNDFQHTLDLVVTEHSRCLLQPHTYEGETLKVAFFSPWPEITAISAIHSAILIHKSILEAKFNSHGLAISLHCATTISDAFSDAMYLIYFIGNEYPTPPFDSRMLITEEVWECLPHSYQKLFSYIGKKNIAKKSNDPAILRRLFELDIDSTDSLLTEITGFLDAGVIAILPDGIWPGFTEQSIGDSQFFKYLIDSSKSEIKILQTYIPGMDLIKDNLREAISRRVDIKVLLLHPQWELNDETKILFEDIIKVGAKKIFPSPVAFQRGKDFNYEEPLRYASEIYKCKNDLDKLRKGIYKLYNATPSVCLHIFDNLMFVGNFLQKHYAVATPNFVIVKGTKLFTDFEKEFDQLWINNKK
jgi:hypothetical protein